MASTRIIFVLVETKYSGNLGMAARAIKNFGFRDLVLVNPLCKIDDEAIYRSMHAKDVLLSARTYSNLNDFVESESPIYLIGTTARIGSEKNPLRIVVPLNMFRNMIFPSESKIAFLFGNEERGLTNEELAKCDLVATIPTSMEYPTLNLSHAVAVVAYELSQALETFMELPYRPANNKEREILLQRFYELVDVADEKMPEPKKEIYKGIIKNMIGRAFLSGREAHSLIGLIKKIISKLRSQYPDQSS